MSALSGLWPAAAARLAHALWYRPRRTTVGARAFAVLAGAQHAPHRHGDHTLSVYTWGTGPTVLLVHGWSGRAAQFSDFVRPLVCAGYRVLAFDAPAHGRSGGKTTHLPAISDALCAIAAEHEPIHAVVAHSFGVACALHAVHRGLRPARFVAISAPATFDRLFAIYQNRLGLRPAAADGLRRLIEARFGADVWSRFAPVEMARALDLPALVIHDTGDREIPSADAAALADAWPGARRLLSDGLGHTRLLSDAGVIAQALDFIADTASPRRAAP